MDDERTRILRPSQAQQNVDNEKTRILRPSERELAPEPVNESGGVEDSNKTRILRPSEANRGVGDDQTRILRPSIRTNPSGDGGGPEVTQESTRILRPSDIESKEARISRHTSFDSKAGETQGNLSMHEAKAEMLRKVAGIDDGGEKTRMIRRGGETKEHIDVSDNPLTAWLVITGGPGKGISLAVGEGENPVGRGVEARVQLNYGDLMISNNNAFTIFYDRSTRSFTVLNGTSSNIIFINEEPLNGPRPLFHGDTIRAGETILRFIPFCDKGFDWSDVKS